MNGSKIHTSFFLGILLFVSINTAIAQQQKIGYVDTNFILSKMPDYQGIQQQLQSTSKKWNSELERMESEIKQLKGDFQSKKILYTDALRTKKQLEIKTKEQQRKHFMDEKFGAKGEYFKKQKELLESVQRKIFNAINAVAEQQGYDFVFDQAQNSGLLFSIQKWNLNDQILQQLDITLNDTSN